MAAPAAVTANVGVFRCEPSDLSAVYACDLAGYEWVLSPENWRKLIPAKNALLFKAVTNGAFCGYLLASETGSSFHVWRCSVVPKYRGQGVCRRLFGVIDGYPCEVVLQETNAVGLAVATRLGFVPVKVLANRFEGVDGILLRWQPTTTG